MTVDRNKNLNSIIKILLFFVFIPFVFLFVLKDYNPIYFECGKIKITSISLKSTIGFASIFAAVFSIILQINKEKRINESRFILDLNNAFSKNKKISNFFYLLSQSKKDETKLIDFLNDSENSSVLLEYVCFFESINVLLQKRILKISTINNLFSRRFCTFTNNPYIQKYFILKNNIYLKNIYQLHEAIIEYRKDKGLSIYNEAYSLEKIDPEYSNIIYTDKIDIKYIVIFLISLFIFLLSVIYKTILRKNICHEISIEISVVISLLSGIVGAISVLISTTRNKKTTEGRFITDLNNNFILNDKINKIVYILENDSKLKKFNDISIKNHVGVSEYLIFFEIIYNSLQQRAISIVEVDKLFCKRFFMMVNNKTIQKDELIKNADYHINIYYLYDLWTKYRLRHGLDIPFYENSLDKNDPDFKAKLHK